MWAPRDDFERPELLTDQYAPYAGRYGPGPFTTTLGRVSHISARVSILSRAACRGASSQMKVTGRAMTREKQLMIVELGRKPESDERRGGCDEGEVGLAGKGAAYEQSYGGYALCEARVDRDQRDPLMKKTYAAVAAAASWADDVGIVHGEAAIGAGVGSVEGTKDWTSMFERRGPLVEVVDV